MAVIFDEVEGCVEPATTTLTDEDETECADAPRETELAALKHELNRLALREARLRAD